MSLSQFTLYTSGDASGPGPLSGTVGSVLTILDACLVNGYTGKTAAGWTKPFSNASNIGCYKQGAGTGMTLVINDAGSGSGGAQEFLASGWRILTGIASGVGAGSGQFPTAAQLNTVGAVVGRKSNAASSSPRTWCVYADSITFYFFMSSGDNAPSYMDFMFGDIFSLAGKADAGRCMIIGRSIENNGGKGTSITGGGIDYMSAPANGSGGLNPGAFIGSDIAGAINSMTAYTFGNMGLASSIASSTVPMAGIIPQINPYDQSFVLSPVFIVDANLALRGYLRGLYHPCHGVACFTDGQAFNGIADFYGKSFVIVKPGSSAGMYAIETSATVSTN